jgi:hypothetical protein
LSAFAVTLRIIDKGVAAYETISEFLLDGMLPSARHLRRQDFGSDDGKELGLAHVPIGPLLELRLTATAMGLGRFRVALGDDDMAARLNGEVRRNGTVFGYPAGAPTYMRPEVAHPDAAAQGSSEGTGEDGGDNASGPFAADDTSPDSEGEEGEEDRGGKEAEEGPLPKPGTTEPDYKSYQPVRDARATHVNQWYVKSEWYGPTPSCCCLVEQLSVLLIHAWHCVHATSSCLWWAGMPNHWTRKCASRWQHSPFTSTTRHGPSSRFDANVTWMGNGLYCPV